MKTLKVALLSCSLIAASITAAVADPIWVPCPTDHDFAWREYQTGHGWSGKIANPDSPYQWSDLNIVTDQTVADRPEISATDAEVRVFPTENHTFFECRNTAKFVNDYYTSRLRTTLHFIDIRALQGKHCTAKKDAQKGWGFECQ